MLLSAHSTKLPGWSSAVAISGDYAYVAAGSRGLHVVGLSGPEGRKLLGSVGTKGWSWDVEVRDGLAYVADGSRGMAIVDVSTPSAPTVIGRIETPYDASDVEHIPWGSAEQTPLMDLVRRRCFDPLLDRCGGRSRARVGPLLPR